MKTTTQQATVIGQVQAIESANNDYIIEFVIKTIREGENASINVSSSPWRNWQLTSLKKGDEVQITGQLHAEVWQDPFENEEWEILKLEATDVSMLAA